MVRAVALFFVAAAALLAGCGQPVGRTPQPSETEAERRDDDLSSDDRLFGVERFTIVYEESGHESGEVVEHVRDWGRRRAETKNTTLSIGGISHRTQTRTVQSGAQIATVNLVSGDVTLATNPLYEALVEAASQPDVEVGRELMTRMGGRPTGEQAVIAGHECVYWELAQLGSRACVTSWGATLHNTAALGALRVERIATDVRIGDGGPDEAFEFDASRATRVPEIHALTRGGD